MSLIGIGTSTPTATLMLGKAARKPPTLEELVMRLWPHHASSMLFDECPYTIEIAEGDLLSPEVKPLIDGGYLVRDKAREAERDAKMDVLVGGIIKESEKMAKAKKSMGSNPAGEMLLPEARKEPSQIYIVGRFEESKDLVKEPEYTAWIETHPRKNHIPTDVAKDVRSSTIARAGYYQATGKVLLHVYWNRDDYNLLVIKDWRKQIMAFPKWLEAERVRWVLREIVDLHAEWAYRKGLVSCGVLEEGNMRMDKSDPDDPVPVNVTGQLKVDIVGQDIAELGNVQAVLNKYMELRDRLDKSVKALLGWAPGKLERFRRDAMLWILDQASVWVTYQRKEKEEVSSNLPKIRKEHAEFVLAHAGSFSYEALFEKDPDPVKHRGNDGPTVMVDEDTNTSSAI